MVVTLLLILVILWVFGYANIQGLSSINLPLFNINGNTITLFDLLIFVAIAWAVGILPSPLRQIAGILLLVWILSVLGILSIVGLPSIVVIAVILALVFTLF